MVEKNHNRIFRKLKQHERRHIKHTDDLFFFEISTYQFLSFHQIAIHIVVRMQNDEYTL